MISEDDLRIFIYSFLKNNGSYSKYYICGHPQSFYYQYSYGQPDGYVNNVDDVIQCFFTDYDISFNNHISNFFDTNGKPKRASNSVYFNTSGYTSYFFDAKTSGVSFNIDKTKILYTNFQEYSYKYKRFKDLLVDTDFYTLKKNDQLISKLDTLSTSTGSSDTSISFDMTETNNILYLNALILCVIFLYLFLRKLFNRGVN